jgi:hypothetical protein
MIAVDTNILVYAHRQDTAFHAIALSRVNGLAEGREPWAIPWPCVHEFFAVATHPRLYDPPSTIAEASRQIEVWLASPTVLLLAEDQQYWPVLAAAVTAGKIVGPRVHDARIAALCRLHGVNTLWSADRDFSRFPNLSVVNPLTA